MILIESQGLKLVQQNSLKWFNAPCDSFQNKGKNKCLFKCISRKITLKILGGILLKNKDILRKKADYELITFNHFQYNFFIARFKKCFLLPDETEPFFYFIYVLKEDYRVAGKKKGKTKIEKYNVMCFNQDFKDFNQMILLLCPILEEYILEPDVRYKLIKLARKLNPCQ